jgi:hypothetical protein
MTVDGSVTKGMVEGENRTIGRREEVENENTRNVVAEWEERIR